MAALIYVDLMLRFAIGNVVNAFKNGRFPVEVAETYVGETYIMYEPTVAELWAFSESNWCPGIDIEVVAAQTSAKASREPLLEFYQEFGLDEEHDVLRLRTAQYDYSPERFVQIACLVWHLSKFAAEMGAKLDGYLPWYSKRPIRVPHITIYRGKLTDNDLALDWCIVNDELVEVFPEQTINYVLCVDRMGVVDAFYRGPGVVAVYQNIVDGYTANIAGRVAFATDTFEDDLECEEISRDTPRYPSLAGPRVRHAYARFKASGLNSMSICITRRGMPRVFIELASSVEQLDQDAADYWERWI